LKCPNIPNPENKRTRSQKTFEEENIWHSEKMKQLKKEFPKEIKAIKTYWHCEFDKIIKADDVFRTQIYPNLRFFHRLSPRDAIVGGYRLLKKLKWDAEKDVNTKLLFLDINGNSSANSKLKTGMVPY